MNRYEHILYTMPHTGTNFIVKFFEAIGQEQTKTWRRWHAFQIHPKEITDGQLFIEQRIKNTPGLVVTARNPYLSAIRHFHSSSNGNLIDLHYGWGRFFDMIESRGHFVVDIGCKEENRFDHLCDLVKYLNLECDTDIIKQFADKWKPENTSDSKAKNDYLKNGTLPVLKHGESWDLIADAVSWYKSLPTNAQV